MAGQENRIGGHASAYGSLEGHYVVGSYVWGHTRQSVASHTGVSNGVPFRLGLLQDALLLGCVSLHAINNGISFLLAYLFPDLPADMSIRAFLGDQPYFISLGISLVLFFAVIYYLHKKLAYIPVKETTYERT
jgi:hypothetical protein